MVRAEGAEPPPLTSTKHENDIFGCFLHHIFTTILHNMKKESMPRFKIGWRAADMFLRHFSKNRCSSSLELRPVVISGGTFINHLPPLSTFLFSSHTLCCSQNSVPLFLQLKEIFETKCKINWECRHGTPVTTIWNLNKHNIFFCSSTGKQFHFLAHANLSLFAEFFCKNITQNVTKASKQMMLFFCLWLAFFLDYANSTPLLSHNSIFLLYLILTSE